MQQLRHRTFCFDDFTLDLTRGGLLRGGEEVKLRPKSFEVLKYLVENGGRLVTKAELMRAVWPDTAVTDDSLVQCLIEIRRALGDDSRRYVKTVPRRGYVFDAQVVEQSAEVVEQNSAGRETVYTEEVEGVRLTIEEEIEEETKVAGDLAPAAPEAAGTRRLPGGINRHGPALAVLVVTVLTLGGLGAYLLSGGGGAIDSVAVMPFRNVGGDPEAEYLSDGFTEGVINNLSRLRDLKVMSRSSVFRYKGKEIDPQTVARELGVRAVLVSRLEPRGENLVVNLELVDARDGRQLWGEQYTRRLSDIIQLQTEISREVSGKLRRRLTGEDRRLLTKQYTENAQAYQLYLKGRYHWEKWTIQDAEKSVDYFQQAIRRDPAYTLAYTGLADAYFSLNGLGARPPHEIM
ncbi:MAG: winged helix-turn-helix domain-containing protein, partial [Pyrinomonadaceae bacterium]